MLEFIKKVEEVKASGDLNAPTIAEQIKQDK
jgi:hypothetical protein